MPITNDASLSVYKEVNALKKVHRRGIALPSRAIAAGLLILFQIAVFAAVGMSLSKWVKIIDLVIRLLAFVLVFAIINKRSNPIPKPE